MPVPNPIELSTLRILNTQGQTIGTGFLVSRNLVATCAHVVVSIGMNAKNCIQVQFTGEKDRLHARILDEFLDYEQDVSILEIEAAPKGVNPFRLGSAVECRPGNAFRSYGYATAADVQGIHANGKIDGYLNEDKLLQLQSAQANHGISGAPVLDEKRGVVVGMIAKGHTELGRNELTTFATPSETLWQVCPQLKPYIPPLPRRNPFVEGINLLPYDYDQRIQNFLTEYLGTNSHPVPFGGRDDALKMLDSWLAETTPYLLLASPAGRGKSALLVRWLDSLKVREDLALAFVPVSIRFGTNMERVFYAALAARLAYLHGDDIPASPETSTAVYHGLVSDYLSKPLANGRTLLVVLDGLDEAADWQAGADFMPSELPARVRVVVSARFLAGDADSTSWLRRLNWERNGLSCAPSLTPLDHDGVRDVLFKMGCPLDELSRKVDIVAELYRLSEGDPLLVGLYVGDLWATGDEVTHLIPENLAKIDPHYSGYFVHWWEDQETLWGADIPLMRPNVQMLINLLACALSGLTREDLVRLAPQELNRYTLDNALKVLQRFTIGDGINQGYTFSHPKLGQYFWEALTPTEQAQVEERFLAWGGQTLQEFIDGKRNPKKKDEVPAYVVRNYGAHLAKAQQPIEKWLPLIHHQQWAQAWFIVEGAYGGYLQDVQRIWEQCRLLDKQAVENIGKASYLGKQIRCGLIEASLHSLAGNIPIELFWPLVRDGIWTLPQAWALIRQMTSAKKQANAIIALLPHVDDGKLVDALSAARSILDHKERTLALNALAQRLPEVTTDAIASARAIKDEIDRAKALSLLGYIPEIANEALVMAHDIIDDKHRAEVLCILAQYIPHVAADAIAIVKSLQSQIDRQKLLIELAKYIPENELGQVLVEARKISNGTWRADVLKELALRIPEAEVRQLLDDARAIPYNSSRAEILGSLATRIPEITGEALIIARNMGYVSADTMSVLAKHLPELSLWQVLENALLITEEYQRVKVLILLAQRMPEEELNVLLIEARKIQSESGRAKTLSALAERMSGVAIEALESSWVIDDDSSYADILSTLAQGLPEVVGDAFSVAMAIDYEEFRANALYGLVNILPESKLEQVLKAAREFKNEDERASMINKLAQHMPDLMAEAIATIRSIRDDISKVYILIDMIGWLPRSQLKQILQISQELKDNKYRSQVMTALAQRSPEFATEALDTVRKIDNLVDRADHLTALAKVYPEVATEALDTARNVKQMYERAKALINLVKYFPEVAIEALDAARKIDRVYERAKALIDLVEYFPEIAIEALSTFRMIQDEMEREWVFPSLVKHLPDDYLKIINIFQIINDKANLKYYDGYSSILFNLIERLPITELEKVLPNLRKIPDYEGEQSSVLSMLVKRLLDVDKKTYYHLIEISLPVLSNNYRIDLFTNISALMPALLHIGPDDIDREIYEAVRDVTTWWP